jgi:hypothetical protein
VRTSLCRAKRESQGKAEDNCAEFRGFSEPRTQRLSEPRT